MSYSHSVHVTNFGYEATPFLILNCISNRDADVLCKLFLFPRQGGSLCSDEQCDYQWRPSQIQCSAISYLAGSIKLWLKIL